jgi:LacI family transcriptional regulator
VKEIKMNSVEIAKLAGVSRSTVSRVINNYSNVPEETRLKVLEVIDKYNYVPHASARMLAGKNNKVIGLIIIDTKTEHSGYKVSSSSYFSQFTSLVIDNAKKFGYNVLVSTVSSEKDFNDVKDIFYNRTISGGIFIGGMNSDENIIKLIEEGFKIAVVGQDPRSHENIFKNAILVNVDNFKGAYEMTKYLIELGHRNIGHISGDLLQISAIERLNGYKKAMEVSNIKINENFIVSGNFTEDSGFTAAIELLKKERPTAIFAANDNMAIGCLRAAEKLNIEVPSSLTVSGFDDVEISRYIRPSLTTVRLPINEMGEIITSNLIRAIEEESYNYKEYILNAQLIKRESSDKVL